MKRVPVDSGELRSVGYAPCASVLEIEFAGGELRQYLGVPTSVHDGLLAAPDPADFFHQRIRAAYASRLIGPAPTASARPVPLPENQ